MGSNGWPFANVDPFPAGADEDHLYQSEHVKLKADPNYAGRFTVSEIIRILNTAFNEFLPADKVALDYYPEKLRSQIDVLNEWIYPNIKGQASPPPKKHIRKLSLKYLTRWTNSRRFLMAKTTSWAILTLTEADVLLWVTLIRFDPVYVGHFKCNLRTIRDGYPNTHRWTQKLYLNNAAFKDSTNFEHIKTHYYWSHHSINPTRVVPAGPIPTILPL